jgi:hypothetical protein
MAQATHTIITRRSLVAATAAGVSAFAAPSSAQALAAPDPVFALIAAHKAAYVRFEHVCRFLSDLEGQIPEQKREEWFREDRAEGLGANDDPRWTSAKATYWAASDAEENAAWALRGRPRLRAPPRCCATPRDTRRKTGRAIRKRQTARMIGTARST